MRSLTEAPKYVLQMQLTPMRCRKQYQQYIYSSQGKGFGISLHITANMVTKLVSIAVVVEKLL